jgi:hypothetical protein
MIVSMHRLGTAFFLAFMLAAASASPHVDMIAPLAKVEKEYAAPEPLDDCGSRIPDRKPARNLASPSSATCSAQAFRRGDWRICRGPIGSVSLPPTP